MSDERNTHRARKAGKERERGEDVGEEVPSQRFQAKQTNSL
jgi:hypothetical protein